MNKQNDKKEGRKQNKDINTRTNKLAKIMLIVLIAIFTLATLIVLNRENIIELGDNINNLIERRNSELVKGEEKGVTDIDLTGLVTGEDTEHTHIYETVTNSTEHWKQCIICNNKIDVEKHILGEKTWAAGSESCEKNNFYTQRCKCGYQVKGRKPCIWDGHSYERTTNYRHIKTCNVCKGQIDNEYYIENDLNTLYVNKIEQCVNSKGNITCSNLGICDVCNSNWNSSPHQLNAKAGGMVGTSEIYCQRCNKSFGTVEFNITNNHSAPSTYTGNLTVNLTNGATIDTTHNGTVREIGKQFETINSVRTDISSTSAKYTISSTFKNIWKEYYFAYYIVSVVINGYKTSIYLCNSFYMYPDTKVQQVPTVQVMDSEEIEGDWATNKEIKISGDEDYCNYVTVKIKDDAGKEIFSGKATAKNGKYALSCIPELEADANGRTFQVEVTDSNNNSITKEFKVDRVDSKAPTLIESGEYTKEWSKNKEISFTAEDKGVGNVEIAFNNANDYQSATKENDRYVRKYNFYGDVYDKVTAAIYLKDGLGNERTVKVDIGKLDNTAPKITETNIAEGKVKITSNDRHEKLGGGSGIVGYRYLTSMEEINEEITESMGTYIEAQEIPLDELKKAKYVYIAPVDRAGNIGNTVKVDLPTYSYSVNYYEEGSQTKVAQSKIVENKLLGEEVEEQAIDIEGYVKVEPSTKKITIKQSENKIDFLYRKRTDISYTVKYLEKGTNKEIYESKVVANQTFGDTITEQAIDIPGYDLESAQEQNLTIKVDGNEIIFYYVKSDTNVLVHHYKEGTMVVETDENGKITNNKTVVTYYYAKKSAGVEEHHIDIRTNKEIEEPILHEGHIGDEYDIKAKDFLSYKLVEEDEEGNSKLPENAKGTMTEEKIVVNYYYNQPAKVVVHYVEKATGKELEEKNKETGELQSSQIVVNGLIEDEYKTEAKEFEYYTLIETELPQNAEGKMKVEIVENEKGEKVVNNTVDVYYYYQAKPFNIGVEKEITGIVVNGERKEITNGKLEKVEIYRKKTEETSVQIEYKIKVTNTGEIAGTTTIEENLPEGMKLANNDGMWEEQDGKLIKVIPEIGAGETKEYTVLLNWEQTGENMGEKANEVKLVETGNVPGFVDNNDKDNTSKAKEKIII